MNKVSIPCAHKIKIGATLVKRQNMVIVYVSLTVLTNHKLSCPQEKDSS